VFYVFGGFLVFTGIKMAQHEEAEVHPERNMFIRLCRRIFPVTPNYAGANFFVRDNGKIWATPLFLVLVMVETTDLVFALDSIPAILAVTQDPLIIYSSNVFAILGLRSLYFVLAGVIDRFRYLKMGLAAVLSFVGIKMLLTDFYKVPVQYSLLVISAMLLISILASVVPKKGSRPRAFDESVDDRANGQPSMEMESDVIAAKKKIEKL
jgi:tellurite resistance protein TerC